MVKIVILGSLRHGPYEVLVPEPIPWATQDDAGYEIAAAVFHPAIEQADVILAWAPDGVCEHTGRDIAHANKNGKTVILLSREGPVLVDDWKLQQNETK